MQLISIIQVLLTAALVNAAPVSTISKRADSATVVTDLASISSDIATLTTDALAYTGTLLQSFSLGVIVAGLESAITSATTDATASAAFTTAGSTSVTSAVTTLTPKIVTLLTDLGAKYSVIVSAGYTSLVASALAGIYTDTDALFSAIVAKADAADAVTLAALKTKVDTAFDTATAAF
ncbi:hypothetical protein LSUE1_G003898 [Lachnellula suecica]|uniref:Hydrophobic surface binding protein n=1 Tax=Lachnellula suecica TaxID=602035 RepID=A0A8T9CF42_9HELO|nr:hypothetical protein LSUE1_G003898 [Lachnellula suecica]